MASIIISADDFGKSGTANKNILELVKTGRIQRVAVLVNGILSKNEVRELSESKVKLDVHLILPGANANWVNRKIIRRSFRFLALLLSGKTALAKVEKSWQQQIEKFHQIFGRWPDGLNSHEHTHFFPPYFKVALKLKRKYQISHLRAAQKIISNGHRIGRIIKVLNGINTKKGADYEYLTSLDWIDNLDKSVSNLPKGNLEVVCHPEREQERQLLSGSVFPSPAEKS